MTRNTTNLSLRTLHRLAISMTMFIAMLFPALTSAQVPGRFYWKSLAGGNAVPVIFQSISGNSNPFDSANTVTPGAEFDATMAIVGYAHTFTFLERSATIAFIAPMGRVSSEVTLAALTTKQYANGFGDPMLEFDINLIGPKSQKTLSDALRYEPGFSLDLLTDLALPIGTYNSSQSLNLGQNRWYGRIGLPVVWQLGPWVPGRRTTLEFLPAVWLFGDNDDFSGQTLQTDPMIQLDAHLTRDLTEKLWGSLDGTWYQGGQATIDGISGEKLNNFGLGLTLGYTINENLNLTFGYKSTLNSNNDPTALQMDNFMITLVSGWHPLVEGARRLGGE